MGLAFLAFIPLAGDGKTPLLALVGILFLFTLAELFLSPIGLSVTTKLAPEAFRTQMVALFFLSVSLGTTLAGILVRPVQPGGRAAVLHRHRRHRHAAGRRPGRGLAGDQEAHGRRTLSR